jgi:hypothetical protein
MLLLYFACTAVAAIQQYDEKYGYEKVRKKERCSYNHCTAKRATAAAHLSSAFMRL